MKHKSTKEQVKEFELALWCMKQAKLYSDGKLTKEQIEKLEEIGFPFEHYIEMYKRVARYNLIKDEETYILERWLAQSKQWATQLVVPRSEFDRVWKMVRKSPKSTFRLVDSDMNIKSLKMGNDDALNFK